MINIIYKLIYNNQQIDDTKKYIKLIELINFYNTQHLFHREVNAVILYNKLNIVEMYMEINEEVMLLFFDYIPKGWVRVGRLSETEINLMKKEKPIIIYQRNEL
jgi:hypothetical protein